jgi:serine/threonine protein kinase
MAVNYATLDLMADDGGTMTIVPEGNQEPKTLPHGVNANDMTIDHSLSLDVNAPTIAPLRASVPSEPNAQPSQPQHFGDYQIVREIARGGMGVVYEARQVSLNRTVAIKMILAGQLASQDDVKRFYIEAESAAGLNHTGIVPIYEIGSNNDQHFFSMGFVDGPSLAAILKDGPLSPKVAAECLAHVCDAVQYAHEHGVIHRDLKPGNILLASESASGAESSKSRSIAKLSVKTSGESARSSTNRQSNSEFPYLPKVTDFGLAKQLHGNSELTGTGQVLGTPSYMPPEQADGRVAAVGTLSDVYSLGAILYCMLTGRPPFQSSSPFETLMQVLKEPPIAPRQLIPSLPRDLETICLKAIEKSPAKRYASAAELREELNRYLAGEPILARPITSLERSCRWLWRHPAVALTGAIVLAAIGTVVGTIYSSNRRLQVERDIAIVATDEAKAQRTLSEKRLDKAIEAVDQMMVRTASERWANRPELQEERKKVLEDAVAFYGSFGEESSRDARVQNEAAKAQFRVSVAYLLLNNMDASLKASERASAIYSELITAYPKSTTYLAAASEVGGMTADTHALSARYDKAAMSHDSAVAFAKSACDLEPNDRDLQLRSLDAQARRNYFLLAQNAQSGREALPEMKLAINKLSQQKEGGFAEGLTLGFASSVEGLYLLSADDAQDVQEASQCYDEAWEALENIKSLPAPNIRLSTQFDYTKAIVVVQRGVVRSVEGKSDQETQQGITMIQEGIDLLDQLLRVNPRAVPYRLQKIQTLRSRANVYRYLKDEVNALKDDKMIGELVSEIALDNPTLSWLSRFDSIRKSIDWINELREGKLDQFEARAEQYLRDALPSSRDDVQYNIVCAYVLVSEKMVDKREEYCLKAVSLLNDLQVSGYFKQVDRWENLRRDTDLAPIHGRADFRAFVEAIRKEAAPK